MTSKSKLKLRKFNFQRQERILEPMKPEEDKYIRELLRKIKQQSRRLERLESVFLV